MKTTFFAAAAALILVTPQMASAAGGIYDEPARDVAHTRRVYSPTDVDPRFETRVHHQRSVYDRDPDIYTYREPRVIEQRPAVRVVPQQSEERTTTTTRRVIKD